MLDTIDRANATDVAFTPISPQPQPPAVPQPPSAPPAPIPAPLAAPLPMPPGAGGDAQPALSPEEAAMRERQEEVLKPKCRVWVSFVGETPKGKQRFGRMYLDGMIDIRSLREALQIETVIGERKGLRDVQILAWNTLEA